MGISKFPSILNLTRATLWTSRLRSVWTGIRCEAAWRGLADSATPRRTAPPLQTQVFTSAAGKLNTLAAKNLGKSGQPTSPAVIPGTFDFGGIEDLYFAAAFLPPFTPHGDVAQVPLTLTGWTFQHQTQDSEGKTETEAVPEVAAGIPLRGRLIFASTWVPKALMV